MPSFDSLKFASRQAEKIKPNELRKLLSGAVEKYENEIKETEEDNAISVPEKAKKYKKIKAKIVKVKADYEKYIKSLTIEEDKTTVQNFLKELNRIIKTLDTKIGILESGIAMTAQTKEKRKSLQQAVIPQKEFTEVANAKKTKLETQKHNFKDLEEAEQKLKKESEDILKIASQSSENPDEFILKGIEQYAKAENISLLAAKASVLQYLSPEWKEKVDAEAREYLANFNFSKFVNLPEGSEETETLKILCDEGYMPYFVAIVHYRKMGNDDADIAREVLGQFDMFKEAIKRRREVESMREDARKTIKEQREKLGELPEESRESEEVKAIERQIEETEKLLGEDRESFVLNSSRIFPEAKKYMENMKKTATKEEYEYAINLMYEYLSLGSLTREVFPGFDCDETTLFLQKIALDEGLEIGNYVHTEGHVVLKLDGFPLVLDTYDIKIRSIEECAKQVGYKGEYGGSFWRDDEGEYLAQYENPENFPSKITGYKKVEKSPYTIGENFALAVLISDLREQKHLKYLEEQFGKDWPAYEELIEAGAIMNPVTNLIYFSLKEERKLIYKKALEIDPNFAEAHRGLATLSLEEDEKQVEAHFNKALEINPNSALAWMQYGLFLESKGEKEKAITHFKKAIKIDPNDAKPRACLIMALLDQRKLQEARKELNKIDMNKINNETAAKGTLRRADELLKSLGI